jgi:hypothetical protein
MPDLNLIKQAKQGRCGRSEKADSLALWRIHQDGNHRAELMGGTLSRIYNWSPSKA